MNNANSIVIGDNAVLPLAGTVNNSGTIELASTGGQTRLQVLANGLTLEGGGHVELSDGNGNIIVGTTPDATLTNVDNTISGAGQLGEGQLTLHNKGTIIASGSNALTIDTGANEVVNSGTLRATGSGGLVIHSDIANSGLLWANGGSITTDGNVSGTGSALIDGVATFEMAGAFSENVTLDAGANATLKIDHAADFRGTVAGFDSNDVLDLADLAFGSSTTLGYAANSNNTGGTLTASDGTHTANIELLGQYTAASFVMSADGFGGTLIHDVGTVTQPNRAPAAVADTGDATEKGGIANGSGGAPATGNVLTNDTDPDGDTKTVTAVSFGTTNGTLGTALAGAYGSLVLTATGAFSYTVADASGAVQALQSTDTRTDAFTYTTRDTAGATSSTTLTVTVQGANDAPVLASQTANQSAVVGSPFTLTLPAGTFTDADTGDTLTYAATKADGTALPPWLTFTPSTRTFTGTPTTAETVGVKVTGTDLGGLFASEVTNGLLTAITGTGSTAATQNEVYPYDNNSLFPKQSTAQTNYWADVVFIPTQIL